MFREIDSFWLRGPAGRSLTLEEVMQYIPVFVLYELSALFAASETDCKWIMQQSGVNAGKEPLDQASRERWLKTFEKAKTTPQFAKVLPFAMDTIDRIIEALNDHDTKLWRIGELFRDLERRIGDELKKQIHYQVDPGLVALVYNPELGWESVIAKFPEIKSDATEASWCLVFFRWTASVFHLMRVMECGIDRLSKMARVSKKRPGWDGLLVDIDKKQLAPKAGSKKTAAKRKKDRFIADAVMQLRAVKEARNTTMHDYSKVYTPNQAIELFKAVQSFMQKMAEAA